MALRMDYFARHTAVPTFFTFASITPDYTVCNWTVRVQRPALEFSTPEVAGAEAFSVLGIGTAMVVTGARYRVTTTGSNGSKKQQLVRADDTGRRSLTLDLEPGNPYQQYTQAAEQADATEVTTWGDARDGG